MKPRVSMIAAISENRVLGNKGVIPWKIPTDIRRFRAKTLGHVIIMGRKTYDSVGHAFPKRTNIVVTRDPSKFKVEDAIIVDSIEKALEKARELERESHFAEASRDKEIFVIGGGEIFTLALPYADKLYLTLVKGTFEGDAFFPEYEGQGFDKVTHKEEGEENGHHYTFIDLERTTSQALLRL